MNRVMTLASLCLLMLSGCESGSSSGDASPSAQDLRLAELIERENLTGDPSTERSLPSIQDALPQLGKKLFFSKSLGGGFDAACASCHHPALGGADQLSFSIGVDAVDPDLLGIGRENNDGSFPVPRNAPTTFNVGLWDRGLFWDSRVESLSAEPNQNGASGGIRTPDSSFGIADVNAGDNLAEAQARFPVTSDDEMKTADFESGSDNDSIRDHLAARLGDYGEGADELLSNDWLNEFRTAFVSSESAESLITFANVAKAIGEYERSQVFVDTPWKRYVEGDYDAISDTAKSGAELFFNRPDEGGAGCAGCHSGDAFTDELHHVIAFPQIGLGKGDGTTGDDDFGRERESADSNDRYHFRTPSLLNVEMTAPYTHAGAYASLEDVVRHYANPEAAITDYFDNQQWCDLSQFSEISDCQSLFPNAENNTLNALDKLDAERLARTSRLPNIQLNEAEIAELVAFLKTLTDPCTQSRTCLSDWIADNETTGPDGQQLNAENIDGDLL